MNQDQRNKKAEQLRLAAHIIETGCEWEAWSVICKWMSLSDIPDPVEAIRLGYEIRIKEWKLPDPPAGRKWHRDDWTQEMLEGGWRPLLDGEKIVYGAGGDEFIGEWEKTKSNVAKRFAWQSHYDTAPSIPSNNGFWRTTRPLPEPVIPVPEGWRELQDSEKDGRWIEGAKWLSPVEMWKHCTSIRGQSNDGAYAYEWNRIIVPVAKPKKRVPLGPCDVVPGSVVRKIKNRGSHWNMIAAVSDDGVKTSADNYGSFKDMMDTYEIKRPTDTEWQGCWKLEVEQ